MTKETQPLVSVRVITYNSSKTVVETLDSIYNQTYPNIELIISDDCSKDDTVSICRDWVSQHKERFVRTEIITVEKNTGVTGNVNRSEEACQGEWVKGIAGDDVLMPNCIQIYMEYVNNHPETVVLFSRVECFGGTAERITFAEKRNRYDFFSWDIEKQLDFLIFEWNCIPTVTNFYNIQVFRKLGLKCDSRIPLLEDQPRWLNVLKAGVKMDFIDEVLVRYRISNSSLSTQTHFSKPYQRSMTKMFRYYQANAYISRFGYIYTLNHYFEIRCLWSGNALQWRILYKMSKVLMKFMNIFK